MRGVLVLVILLCSTSARAEDGWPLHLALGTYMTLNGVDLAETMYLVGSRRGQEANPVMAPFANRPVLMGAVKMGVDSAAVYYILRIHKTHPRIAWLLTGLGIAVESYASIHNARLLP